MAMDMPMNDLGLILASQVKRLRLERRWSRLDLAMHAGINVYTLKHFERTGQISLERLLKICQKLDILSDIVRAFKPRKRVDVDNWTAKAGIERQRGRRRSSDSIEVL